MVRSKNAYSEVLNILNYIDVVDYNKIPSEVITALKNNSNAEYNFEYDINADFSEQNVSEDAKFILAVLFERYWATETQKEKISRYKKSQMQKIEQTKEEKYNVNDIFKKRKSEQIDDTSTEALAMIEYKETWLQKLISKIKIIFRK